MGILLPAAGIASQWWANRPLDATWFSAGARSSASPTPRSLSTGDPDGHLDVAPDRRNSVALIAPLSRSARSLANSPSGVSLWQRFAADCRSGVSGQHLPLPAEDLVDRQAAVGRDDADGAGAPGCRPRCVNNRYPRRACHDQNYMGKLSDQADFP